jgi:hypothetical protein
MHSTDRSEVCRWPPRWNAALISTGLLAAICLASMARANDNRTALAPLLPKYTQECAACHLAYPRSEEHTSELQSP